MIHPTINTALNALSGVLLVCGLMAIRRGDKRRHAAFMIGAVTASFAFLVSYLIYHATKVHTLYEGEGWIRPVYFGILITHVLCAAVNLPMILRTVFFAWKRDWPRHRRSAKWTYPIWLYVSVSGVVVYVMLYWV